MKRTSLLSSALAGLLLSVSACSGTTAGAACETNDDCDSGQTCYADLPGGFCAKGCATEGKSDECPRGSTCAVTGLHSVCAPDCEQQSECREDYECNGITGSDHKVCKPKT
jgi:hypothetical protein